MTSLPRRIHTVWLRLAALVLLLSASGCIRWQSVPIPTPPAPPNVIADRSRIVLKSGDRVEFLTLVVATDSIFGVRNNLGRNRITVSFDQVNRIEVRKKDALRTLGLIGSIVAVGIYSGALGIRLK